jgi:dolichol-phosphate mannosyltransferase
MSETRSRGGEAPDVSIVVPVKNEAGNIEPLVGEIIAALGTDARFEIIYVDDGSSDATADQLRTLWRAGRGCARSGMRCRADNRRRSVPA